MANKITMPSQLRLRYNSTDAEGKARLRSKVYNNVKNDALDEDLFKTAKLIESLGEEKIAEIYRVDTAELTE